MENMASLIFRTKRLRNEMSGEAGCVKRRRVSMRRSVDELERMVNTCSSCDKWEEIVALCTECHIWCKACIEKEVLIYFSTNEMGPFTCARPGCNAKFRKDELMKLLSRDTAEILEGSFAESSARHITVDIYAFSGIHPDLSQNWNLMEQNQDLLLVTVWPSSSEYEEVKAAFHQTMIRPRAEIKRILRIQNPTLAKLYTVKREHMLQELTEERLEERKLFHGTKSDVINAICKENFDWRVCGVNGTYYGQGAYFALEARYSHSFTEQGPAVSSAYLPNDSNRLESTEQNTMNSSGERYSVWSPSTLETEGRQHIHKMFFARVLCGLYTKGRPTYRRPPPLDADRPYDRGFNSCVDNIISPNIYVVFDTCQCYPEYLIEYSNKPR